jgi:hypothetical protein
MSQEENTHVPGEEYDDLSELDGIGERYAAALAEAGIKSFSDLIKYTPKTLSETLKERANVRISEKRIDTENWIGQARQALGRKKLPVVGLPASDEKVKDTEDKWTERGMFQITFESRKLNGEEVLQTRVYDDRSGDETALSGIDPDAWVNWILERTGLHVMTPKAQNEIQSEGAAAQTINEQLQSERDALKLSLSAAQAEAEKTQTRIVALEQELAAARAEVAEARAAAESKARSLDSVTQQAQAQLDAAFRALAAAQAGSRPSAAVEARGQAINATIQTQKSPPIAWVAQQNHTPKKPPISVPVAPKPDLQIKIQNVTVEDKDSPQPREGRISFVIEGNGALLATRLMSSCIIEVRGVDQQGSSSTVLARIEEQLSPDKLQYDVPFTLQVPRPGTFKLHTNLRLKSAGGVVVTAGHEGRTIVQQSVIAPSSSGANGT